MDDYLQPIREELQSGAVSAQSLVHLFQAASEAEQRRDLAAVEEALGLARQVARQVDDALEPEAERLVTLLDQCLERTRGHAAAGEAAPGMLDCPGCGRPVSESAVRCRACGYLFV